MFSARAVRRGPRRSLTGPGLAVGLALFLFASILPTSFPPASILPASILAVGSRSAPPGHSAFRGHSAFPGHAASGGTRSAALSHLVSIPLSAQAAISATLGAQGRDFRPARGRAG